jgi:hypothetical protein
MPTPEQIEHFAALVREMRRLQKKWFGGDRSTATLHEAKKAERAVDKALEEIESAGEQEGRLF